MELRQAHYVLAVVEHGGFSRAAAALHIAQSAISAQVARLERELDVALFDRTRRSPVLTPAGERFVPAARALVAAERGARDAARGAVTRRVGIGAGTRMRELVPDDATTEVLRLARRERLAALRRGTLDAVLVHGPADEPDLTVRAVGASTLTVVVPADAGHDDPLGDPPGDPPGASLEDLAGRTLLVTDDAPRSPVRAALAAAGLGAVTRSVDGDLTDLLGAVGGSPGTWTVVFAERAVGLRPDAFGVEFRTLPGLEVPILELRP